MKGKTMEESKYTIGEIVELIKSADDLKSKVEKQKLDIEELEHQIEFKYNDMKYVLIKRETLRDIVSSIEYSASNALSDAENAISDIGSYVSDAEYGISDAQSYISNCVDDIESLLEEPEDE